MTPQHRQQLEELAKWHEEEAAEAAERERIAEIMDSRGDSDKYREQCRVKHKHHRNAAKLLREVVEL